MEVDPRARPHAKGPGQVSEAALAAKSRGTDLNDFSNLPEPEQTFQSPERFASDFFRLLDNNDILSCSWKSNPHAERALKGLTDIDLLVERSHADRLERLLVEQGFKRLVPPDGAGYPGIEDWLGYDVRSAKLIHIHLHYQILTGLPGIKEFRIPWERLILKTRVRHPRYDSLWVTDPNLEIIILLVRSALKHNNLDALLARMRGKRYLDNLFEELDLLNETAIGRNVESYASKLLDGPARQTLLNVLSSGREGRARLAAPLRREVRAMFRRHCRCARRAMVWRRLTFPFSHLADRACRRLGLRAKKKQIGRGGVIISVIGADGSGKSTISTDIVDFLGWKLEVRHFYLGEGQDSSSMRLLGYFQRFVARALAPVLGRKKKAGRTSPRPATREIEEPGTNSRVLQYLSEISFALRRILIVWEKRRKVTRIMRARSNGAIIVTDRFPQTRISGFYDGPRYGDRDAVRGVLPRLAARMERKFFDDLDSIGPDSVLRLHVTAEIALSRKPDHCNELILKKVQATRAISFPGARHADIDATRPLDVVLREARLRAWESL